MVEEVAGSVEVTDTTIEETVTMPAIGPEGIDCPRHIAIVGLGLIGGSLALRLHSAGIHVSAWNHRPHPYVAARAVGIDCKDSLEELVAEHPDVIVLCNPLVAMPKILETIRPIIDPARTTLTDVGSVKGLVREQVHAAGITDCYVGAHPMTGNEHSGWAAADPSIFDNALWALTYDHHTDYARIVQVAGMITRGLRNTMIVIDDETHDRAASLISHMPHVVSTALINELTANPDRNIAAALSAGSWRDMTRVALTDPARTAAMIVENADNVETLLRSMARRLESFADALHDDDKATLRRFFAEGQPYRDYKARQREAITTGETQTVFTTIRISADDWRRDLLESAKRGEHIVRFTSGHHALAERQFIV